MNEAPELRLRLSKSRPEQQVIELASELRELGGTEPIHFARLIVDAAEQYCPHNLITVSRRGITAIR